jgi:hypothetical protein
MQVATGWPQGNERIRGTERGSTRSHSVENLPWKRLWTCCKTDCGMYDIFWIYYNQTVWSIHSATCITVNNSSDNSKYSSITQFYVTCQYLQYLQICKYKTKVSKTLHLTTLTGYKYCVDICIIQYLKIMTTLMFSCSTGIRVSTSLCVLLGTGDQYLAREKPVILRSKDLLLILGALTAVFLSKCFSALQRITVPFKSSEIHTQWHSGTSHCTTIFNAPVLFQNSTITKKIYKLIYQPLFLQDTTVQFLSKNVTLIITTKS